MASTRRLVILATAALLLIGVGAGGAQASIDGYARGDAEAMLNTYPASDNIFTRLDTETRGLDIRPFDFIYDQIPYCVEDWHVLAYAWWEFEVDAPTVPITYARGDVWTSLDAVEAEFILDGVPIDVVRTPIKALQHRESERAELELFLEELFGGEVTVGTAWGFQFGRIMSPGELSVGQHTLQVSATFSAFPPFEGTTTFQVYGPDSTACTGV